MIRRLHSPWVVAVAAIVAALTTASPATATFTVAVSGATTMVTQTDTDTLIVTRMPDGTLMLSDSGPLVASPPTDNLIVRGAMDPATPSALFIVLDSALPGSLMLDLPGRSNVTLRGDVASIGGTLKVKGGAGDQIVRLGIDGQPTSIEKAVSVDLGDGDDQLHVTAGCDVGGSVNVKGVDTFDAHGTLSIDRSFSFDHSRETRELRLDVEELILAKSLKVKSGAGRESVRLFGGTIGRSVTLDLGDGDGSANVHVDSIGGNLKASFGTGPSDSNFFGITRGTTVKGSTALTMLGRYNNTQLLATFEGKSFKYTGGAGYDYMSLDLVAPRAKTTILLGAGDDDVTIHDASVVQFGSLTLDFGEGADDFFDDGWVPPPGTIITGLP